MIAAGMSLAERLYEAGLVPENCTRVVFDIDYNDAMKVTYTVYATEEQAETFTKTLVEYVESLKK